MDTSSEKTVLREDDVRRALMRIAHEIVERNPSVSNPSVSSPSVSSPSVSSPSVSSPSASDPFAADARGDRDGGGAGDLALSAGDSRLGAGAPALALVGIHRRGAFLAQRLRDTLEELLGVEVPLGDLDIGFYRDDVSRRPDAPVVHASHVDFDVDGRTVVIVDDVLYTGRTVRAAIEALFDYGRPARVQLAVLADRGHRELPIRPDYVGKNLPTARAEHVRVRLKELDGVDEVAIAPAHVEASAA